VVRITSEVAFDVNPSESPDDQLIQSADILKDRLWRSGYFEADGNRKGGSGEFVVYLKPDLSGDEPNGVRPPPATLEVWTRSRSGWDHVRTLEVTYR
jgi:hypothetical protein